MKPDTLQHFSQQLHSWCAERLEQKPGPFRQAEANPHLLGDGDSLAPPVILWINRESYLAGGVILLPQKDEQDIFAVGLETAKALGLPYFHAWSRYDISCWSALSEPPEKIWEYALPAEDTSSPAIFRKSLNLLIDQMEQIFFDQQLQIPSVSDLYLANLIHTTFIDILPAMQKTMQIDQSATTTESIPLVEIKNLLFQTLLIPTGLALCNNLPTGTTPASIIDTLSSALASNPEDLRQVWPHRLNAHKFPAECRRRLHHFCCRIQQLAPYLAENAASATNRLLNEWATQLGGYPVPDQSSELQQIVINPDRCDLAVAPSIEIGPTGILAATALIRHFLTVDKPKQQQITSPLYLSETLSEHQISGTLYEDNNPSTVEQKKLNAFLRISWPNRKLSFSGKTPLWAWQFLHICGLAGGLSQLNLILPSDWLWERYGEVIMTALDGKLGFSRIHRLNPGQLQCQLQPVAEEWETVIERDDGTQIILKAVPNHTLRSRTILALNAPNEINQLLDTVDLEIYQMDLIEDFSRTGLNHFSQSSLGQGLWKLLAPGRTTPKNEKLVAELSRAGVPLPGKDVLAALGRLSRSAGQISTADIDQELAVWIGETLPFLATTPPNRSRSDRKTEKIDNTDERLDSLLLRCQTEEIPNFPEDYLYDTPLSERTIYTFTGQLEIIDSFFDQVVLADQQQLQIIVDGVKQAEALILISSFRSGPVELPQSHAVTAAIVDRYYRELKELRRTFSRHAADLVSDENITMTVDLIWQRLPLPALNLITDS